MNIKILIVEDHELTRERLVYALKKQVGIDVVGAAENGQTSIALVKEYNPDLILMDISMPVMSGIDAAREIKKYNSNIKIIMFTSYSEKQNVLSAFNVGADAYCMKNIKVGDLINIIKSVYEGAIWIDPSIAAYMLEIFQSAALSEQIDQKKEEKSAIEVLTSREKDVLKLVAKGLNNKDIAEELVLSVYTVKFHVSNIIQKLAVEDRTQAAVLAIKENIL